MKLLLFFGLVLSSYADPLYRLFLPDLQDPPHPLIEDLLCHPLFSRLHRVAQLSSLKFFFPHGNIHRAAHSRGSSIAASIYINALNQNSPPTSRISPLQSLAVQVAALLHDIGHGPYSHVFQRAYSSHCPPLKPWSHELQSTRIACHLFNELRLVSKYNLPNDFLYAVCDMILGISPRRHARKYGASSHFSSYVIFTIVNGDLQDSLDVDKFDYMRRDSRMCCHPSYARIVDNAVCEIILNSRILNDRIVYSSRAAPALAVFAHCVYLNYRYLYYHPHAHGLNLLIHRIFEELIPRHPHLFNLRDLHAFLALDDNLLDGFSDIHPDLQSLIGRFHARIPYLFLAYRDLPDSSALNNAKQAFLHALRDSPYIQPYDYVLDSCHFAHIIRNPLHTNILRRVVFYDLSDPEESFFLFQPYLQDLLNSSPSELFFSSKEIYYSFAVPFHETCIQLRLYCTSQDPKKSALLLEIFNHALPLD
ncbi:phosphohydrolase-like protein [Encephalitozoon intestinalis ATCC 50506]|uniref:Phosphohydrolase-like protein n=1 Tax=Encephalitozoon intestinalis (strain ATCC 50506) TaxID=876142 RepID=E0SA76_ENCIT|nr:phosphohydrolase-like protein [Encephalitozoon intestinalis ATCC 50506]ADM12503.1 phosphohydrolase-like protein [Encephalitozoon intestinalis ATCC 50506]UTX46354.1 deoxynucleoside triphosphate triphosphohydrolase SAMHD1 [Encephalitozoon intestinalis]